MSGFLSNFFGLSGNNGTDDSFNNSGSGKQTFGKAKFNTGAKRLTLRVESLNLWDTMSGFLGNILGFNGNNGTEDAFNNKGTGEQEFNDGGEFNTGAQCGRGTRLPCNRNNGTKHAFNNSTSGTQKFGKAKFNTGARIGY
ncbi:hypothetical protein VNO77_01600 [Canavalia gladiata]|uniref:Uncharacterized protein n=1 Tax=Canavalia gladiata TaxID=3824 RepID=A0AAN9MWC9_CANGL